MEIQTVSNYLAEQTYLGIILLEPELAKEAKAKEEMFSAIEHQTIFRNMMEITAEEKPLDIQSLMIRMYENGSIQIVQAKKGESYLTDLAGAVLTTDHFHTFGESIIETYRVREAQNIAKSILTLQGIEGDSKIVYDNLSKMQTVLETGIEKKGSLKDSLIRVYNRLESGGTQGTPTGFHEYDRMTLGVHKGDLAIIGARPSMGKTAFALNMGSNQVEEWNPITNDFKNHVHIFSLEMSEDQLVQRMISTYGRINAQNMRTSTLNDGEWTKLTHAMGHFSNLDNLDIYDDVQITVPEMRAKVTAAIRKFPDRDHIVIIDYLQLIKYHGKATENQNQKVSDISRALKVMAKELKVAVTALSQLSRGVEQRQDKRPMMSDIRESGAIEQDADVITFLYRDDYYDRESENKNIIELIIAKQRNGPTGTVSVAFIKEYGAFINLERRFEQNA
jgi:replicative DNA helicase